MAPDPAPNNRALARDQALARLARARRWIAVAAAALTAAIAALVSAVAPGRSLAAKRKVSRVAAAPVATPKLPPVATAGDLGLQAPSSPPSAASSGAGSSGSSASSDAAAQAAAAAAAAQAAPAPAVQPQSGPPAVSGGS